MARCGLASANGSLSDTNSFPAVSETEIANGDECAIFATIFSVRNAVADPSLRIVKPGIGAGFSIGFKTGVRGLDLPPGWISMRRMHGAITSTSIAPSMDVTWTPRSVVTREPFTVFKSCPNRMHAPNPKTASALKLFCIVTFQSQGHEEPCSD